MTEWRGTIGAGVIGPQVKYICIKELKIPSQVENRMQRERERERESLLYMVKRRTQRIVSTFCHTCDTY
jgi:hypothetical protein